MGESGADDAAGDSVAKEVQPELPPEAAAEFLVRDYRRISGAGGVGSHESG